MQEYIDLKQLYRLKEARDSNVTAKNPKKRA